MLETIALWWSRAGSVGAAQSLLVWRGLRVNL